jgi:dihydrofolate reductase
MGKVIFDITASVDGFVAGPNDSPENPMGDGGMRLFDWYFNDSETSRSPESMIRRCAKRQPDGWCAGRGRRLYDNALDGMASIPCTCRFYCDASSSEVTEINGSFVTDGVESAIKQAQPSLAQGCCRGADIAQQCLKAGLLDEISLHIVPVLLAAASGCSIFRVWSLLNWNVRRRATPKVIHMMFGHQVRRYRRTIRIIRCLSRNSWQSSEQRLSTETDVFIQYEGEAYMSTDQKRNVVVTASLTRQSSRYGRPGASLSM